MEEILKDLEFCENKYLSIWWVGKAALPTWIPIGVTDVMAKARLNNQQIHTNDLKASISPTTHS